MTIDQQDDLDHENIGQLASKAFNDAYNKNKLMGMVQSKKENNLVYKIGCLGKISDYQKSKDGRVLINLTGISRIVPETVALIFVLAVEDPENSDVSAANTNVYVVIQNHIFGVKGAGLA